VDGVLQKAKILEKHNLIKWRFVKPNELKGT